MDESGPATTGIAARADHAGAEPACTLDEVLIADELARRPSRAPDYAAENRALAALADRLASDGRALLQTVVDTAMSVCRADSAGVSILEPGGASGVFRWRATAGALAKNRGGTIPREASPCGQVVSRNEVLLFDRPQRHFPALESDPPICESLLAPWQVDGETAGTLWVIGHTPDRHFDSEDARLLASVARFASAACRTSLALQKAEEGQAAVQALRQSEERYRLIVEEARDYAIFTTDAKNCIETWPPGAEAVFGWTPEEAVGQPAEITFTPEDRAHGAPEQEFGAARASGLSPDVRWHLRKDGERVFIEGSARALRGPGGEFRGVLKIGRDVTDRKSAEEHQRLLLSELQHRVRNILAVVRSIARRTAANSETVEEFAAHLDGRLNALARTQAAVTRDPSAGVNLDQIVGEELLAYATREGGRVQINGPPVRLRPKPAETVGLAVHELATNSVKYGALSTGDGDVRVTWTVQDLEGARRLRFEWREAGSSIEGGPPPRRGFGTELLERTLAYELKSVTTLDFRPRAFTCTIEFPLTDREVAPP